MRMFLQDATVSAMLCEMEAQSVEWKTTHYFALIVSPTLGVQGAGGYRAGNTTRKESVYEGGNEFVDDFNLYKPAFFWYTMGHWGFFWVRGKAQERVLH